MQAGSVAHEQSGAGGPLQGVRVVELTRVWAGPFGGKLLAFLGAEVIKVESLGSLDPSRGYGRAKVNQAPGFQAVNLQKLSVQIDIKSGKGRALVLDLLSKFDVCSRTCGCVRSIALDWTTRPLNPLNLTSSMCRWACTATKAH